MAAGFLQHLAGDGVIVRSAGSMPGVQLHPVVVAAMCERGVDLAANLPSKLTTGDVHESDVVVTMGCGDACPVFPAIRYFDWELDDPAGRSIEEVRPIRDQIEQLVLSLIDDLGLPLVGV